MSGPTSDLLTGIATLLQTAGVGTWTPDGDLTQIPGVAIVLKMMPTTPDRVLVIDVLPTSDDPSIPSGQVAIRLRARGAANDPTSVDDVLDAAFNALHGLTGRPIGSTVVTQVLRRPNGVAQQGFDRSKRWLRTDQYTATVDYPATVLRPTFGAW